MNGVNIARNKLITFCVSLCYFSFGPSLTRDHSHCRFFESAWRYVASMATSDTLRNEYASMLTNPDAALVVKTLDALTVDLSGILTVMRSDEGVKVFRDAIRAIEGKPLPTYLPN